MPDCIICHLEITDPNNLFECPNNHPVHKECLIEWLQHSPNCPLCNEPYSLETKSNLKSDLDKREEEKKKSEEDEARKERNNQIKIIAEKIIFLKFLNMIETLIEKKDFEGALDRLNSIDENKLETVKK
ncbi:MAG: hypothetical protein GF353_10740, partial [Candidatus Lokiarchaeota archaeon]|nr:hypothetical protein [Candidatus Lokiarchaeota archaeon]